MTLAELGEYFASIGEPSYRAGQVFAWLRGGIASFDAMTNISKKLRGRLAEEFAIESLKPLRKQQSQRDGTVKYLWGLADGNAIESVVMKYEHGNTVCVSTQVGCRMGCVFCASSAGGLVRNLTAAEIEDQVRMSVAGVGDDGSREDGDRGEVDREPDHNVVGGINPNHNARGVNVVLMGIGEPLDNFENVLRFIGLVTHPSGMNIGARRISLSTCGIIENIDKLSGNDIQLTLSVSLHAPDDETRSLLMPINRKTGVENLLDACERYFQTTGRRVSYEYALLDGINDTPRHARLLARRLKGTDCHVNLIQLNRITRSDTIKTGDTPSGNAGGAPMEPSKPDTINAFAKLLKQEGINCTVRRRLGGDIDAACGQLRHTAANTQGISR
jgi:23S rRNA (adenine2503-C2)-methyltransferase